METFGLEDRSSTRTCVFVTPSAVSMWSVWEAQWDYHTGVTASGEHFNGSYICLYLWKKLINNSENFFTESRQLIGQRDLKVLIPPHLAHRRRGLLKNTLVPVFTYVIAPVNSRPFSGIAWSSKDTENRLSSYRTTRVSCAEKCTGLKCAARLTEGQVEVEVNHQVTWCKTPGV